MGGDDPEEVLRLQKENWTQSGEGRKKLETQRNVLVPQTENCRAGLFNTLPEKWRTRGWEHLPAWTGAEAPCPPHPTYSCILPALQDPQHFAWKSLRTSTPSGPGLPGFTGKTEALQQKHHYHILSILPHQSTWQSPLKNIKHSMSNSFTSAS